MSLLQEISCIVSDWEGNGNKTRQLQHSSRLSECSFPGCLSDFAGNPVAPRANQRVVKRPVLSQGTPDSSLSQPSQSLDTQSTAMDFDEFDDDMDTVLSQVPESQS